MSCLLSVQSNMELRNLMVVGGVARAGMRIHDFVTECVTWQVSGIPYCDEQGKIVGRLSLRHILEHTSVPDSIAHYAHLLGDHVDHLLSDKQVFDIMAQPVEPFVFSNIPAIGLNTSIVKVLGLLEEFHTTYVFVVEDGQYIGTVTLLAIAKRMLEIENNSIISEKAKGG